MTVEEFWDLYINEKILDIFDETCEFFSQELPAGFTDEYDAIEVILETSGHNETAKNFDKVIKFRNILEQYQPDLYKQTFVYLNDFLVEYYCFHQDKSKVDEAFSLYIENPLEDIDYYSQIFKKLQFYQHTELLNRAIEENYHDISDSELVIGSPYELAFCKLYISLQESFVQGKRLNETGFLAKIEEFDFELSDVVFSSIEKGLLQSQLSADDLNSLLVKDNDLGTLIILRTYFQRYMYERGFEFYLSGYIWDNMLQLWHDNRVNEKTKETTLSSFFRVTADTFEKHLISFTDMYDLDKPKMIATLWGSVYIYDFFYKSEIISAEAYHDFLNISQKLKGLLIGIFTPDLWRSNFVHHWVKPDSVSEDEFREEHNIFTKSLYLKDDNSSVIIEYMSEELAKIGPLADHIIEGGSDKTKHNFRLFEDSMRFGRSSRSLTPVSAEKKVGRNDPCPCGSGKKYKKCCGKG